MSHHRQLFHLAAFASDEITLTPPQWLTQASTPKLVKRLAETLGCETSDLFGSEDGELFTHPALLVVYLLTAIPEAGAALRQLADHDGRLPREHAEARLAEFFSDEAAMVIAGSRPVDQLFKQEHNNAQKRRRK